MPLLGLETCNFRNLQNIQLELTAGIQVIHGDNASGKTSLLEAMHVLCSAKSFLGVSPRKLQQFDQIDFSINGEISFNPQMNQSLQYRWQDATLSLRAGQQVIQRASEYASLQPVQAVTPLSYRIIDDSPDIRRKYIDWGVFHVKHDYIDIWRRFQRSLTQRNAMLCGHADQRTIMAWSQEYIQFSQQVDRFRMEYVEELKTDFNGLISRFFPEDQVEIHYHRGWGMDDQLEELLIANLRKDMERHFTFYGPQRAELQIKFNNRPARDVISRGQKKLITFALYLSQAHHHHRNAKRAGLLLIDDLPSELDRQHQSIVLQILNDLSTQVVLTCIDHKQLNLAEGTVKKLFHVKRGQVKEVLQ
jgi:DNA replication and repair protein RecF